GRHGRETGSGRTDRQAGTWGKTRSTKGAAVSAIRRPQQDGQTELPLQDSGSSRSLPHDSHLSRKNPQANTPQDKYARISRSINCGTSRPRSCWRARNVSRWAAIVRYSSDSSGFRGRYSFLSLDPDRTQE